MSGDGNYIPHDHEMFLRAFEKPTQIYRYLGIRYAITPVFLHRNLSYMKDRMSRDHKKRKEFKVDQMLCTAEEKYPTDFKKCMENFNYMSLMFIGVFDKSMFDLNSMNIEVFITNTMNRRRTNRSMVKPILVGSASVRFNPELSFNEIPAISIPIGCMKSNEYSGCTLLVRLTAKPNQEIKRNAEEPMITAASQPRIVYETEMSVFENNRCNLFDGDFEVNLTAVQSHHCHREIRDESPKKHSTWEELSAHDIYDGNISKLPTLRFRLSWTKDRCNEYVDRPLPITIRNERHHQFESNKDSHLENGHDKSSANASNNNNNKTAFVKLYDIASRIIYRFIYNNHSSQQTEACDNFNCPWCNLNCVALYSLLKHLKLCHPRFNFTYVPTEKSVRIDVTINDMFDCSYSGSPFDLIGSHSSFFGKDGPAQRTPVTHILVCHPHRPRPTLTEFLEIDENEGNSHRPIMAGHNRTYYHIMTYTPIMPKEFDDDSEDENDPAWLRNKTINMIDDFTDVNDGEKEMMKMWNLHIMRHNLVGDVQIVNACELFLEERGKELVQKNLYRNFLLHLTNLFDHRLLLQQDFYAIILRLHRVLCTNTEGLDIFAKAIDDHMQNWLHQQNDERIRESKAKNTSQPVYMKKAMGNGRPRHMDKSPSIRGRTRSSFSSAQQQLHSSMVISPNRKRQSTYRTLPTPSSKKYACDNGREHREHAASATASSTRRRRAVQSLPNFDLRNRDSFNRDKKMARFNTRNRSQSQTGERRTLSVTRTRSQQNSQDI